MLSSGLDFILLFFASFRLTRLIVFDKITEFIRKPFHDEVEEVNENGEMITYIEVKGRGVQRFIGELLSCYWCTGIWCAAFLYAGYELFPTYIIPVIIILAIAGCASLIEAILERISDE